MGSGEPNKPAEPWARDLELARGARAGDGAAIEALLERLRCVRRFHVLKNEQLGRPLGKHELEDLVQETLIALWQKLDLYAGSGSLEAWAYRFATLRFLTRLRNLDYRPRLIEDVSDDIPEPQAPPIPDRFRFEYLYQVLERVSAGDRDLITMKFFEQRTFQDLARQLGVPPSTVKTRFYRALARVRGLLEAKDEDKAAIPGGRT